MQGETTHDVGGPLTIIANPLLFVALIIVLRKLGLNGNFKEDFFTDNAKYDFGHINACIGDREESTLKSQGGQLVISRASHLYQNCIWLEFQST